MNKPAAPANNVDSPDVKKFKNKLLELCYVKENDGDKSRGIPIFPYVVAVTGQEDSVVASGYSEEDLQDAFRTQLRGLVEKWKDICTRTTPIILLTGLLKGPDQFAAEVALEDEFKDKVKVVAVLPMKKDIFEEEIINDGKKNVDPKSRELYDWIIKQQVDSFELPFVEDNNDQNLRGNGDAIERRNKQFRQLSRFLAIHSHVLFAFWDGEVPQKSAGTTDIDITHDVIEFKILGDTDITQDIDYLTFPAVGPVIHFFLPKKRSNSTSSSSVGQKNKPEPDVYVWSRERRIEGLKEGAFIPSSAQDITQADVARCEDTVAQNEKLVYDTIEKLGTLNKYIYDSYDKLKDKGKLEESKTDLIRGVNDPDEGELDKRRNEFNRFLKSDEETQVLFEHYAIVDQLALKFQTKTKNTMNKYLCLWFCFLLFSGFLETLLDIQAIPGKEFSSSSFYNFLNESVIKSIVHLSPLGVCAIIYLSTVILLFWLYSGARKKGSHYIFHRCRCVAEALRVQFFWRIAGVEKCVSRYYPSYQSSKTDWVRTGLNGLDVLFRTNDKLQDFNKVKQYWVEAQKEYFSKTPKRRRDSSKALFQDEICCSDLLIPVFMGTALGVHCFCDASIRNAKLFQNESRPFEPFQGKFRLFTHANLFIPIFLGTALGVWFLGIPLLYSLLLGLLVAVLSGSADSFIDSVLQRLKVRFGFESIIAFFTFIILLIIALPFGADLQNWIYKDLSDKSDWGILLIFVLKVPLTILGMVFVYAVAKDRMQRLSVEADRYERAFFPFDRASRLLNACSNPKDIKEIIRNLGTEALEENTEWYLSVGERDLTVPR